MLHSPPERAAGQGFAVALFGPAVRPKRDQFAAQGTGPMGNHRSFEGPMSFLVVYSTLDPEQIWILNYCINNQLYIQCGYGSKLGDLGWSVKINTMTVHYWYQADQPTTCWETLILRSAWHTTHPLPRQAGMVDKMYTKTATMNVHE